MSSDRFAVVAATLLVACGGGATGDSGVPPDSPRVPHVACVDEGPMRAAQCVFDDGTFPEAVVPRCFAARVAPEDRFYVSTIVRCYLQPDGTYLMSCGRDSGFAARFADPALYECMPVL